ncbi:MAG: hypothetical protein WC004_03695 [Candidatus Absconditabacterales bacterium]
MNGFGGIIAYSNKDIYEERTAMQKIFDFLEEHRTTKANQGLVVIAEEIQRILDELIEEFTDRYKQLKQSGIISNSIKDILSCKDQYTKYHQEFAIMAANWEATLWNNEETLKKLHTTPEKLLGRIQPEKTTILAWE